MASATKSKNNNGTSGKAAAGEGPKNVALEPCEISCVPEFRKNGNTNVKKECDPSLLTKDLCFVEKKVEKAFYDAIDWETLKDNIDYYMAYFVEELNQNKTLARAVQEIYKFGPIQNTSGETTKRFGRLGFTINMNENFQFCDNIVIKITISNYAGLRTQEIAHITLHSKLPVYYREKLRSRSGCGYYQKGVRHIGQERLLKLKKAEEEAVAKAAKAEEAAAEAEAAGASEAAALRAAARAAAKAAAKATGASRTGESEVEEAASRAEEEEKFGPFHYQVDTLYWKHPAFSWETKNVPFFRFEPNHVNLGELTVTPKNLKSNIAKHPIDFSKFEVRLTKEDQNAVEKEAYEATTEFFKSQGKSVRTKGEASFLKTDFTRKLKEIYKVLKEKAIEEAIQKERDDPDTKGSYIKTEEGYIAAMEYVHTLISNEFVRFWNELMLWGYEEPEGETRPGYTGFPPLLKTLQRDMDLFKLRRPLALKDENVVMDLSQICDVNHVYSGFFLQNEVANKLFLIANDVVPPEFKFERGKKFKVHCGHVTMGFGNTTDDAFFSIKDKYYQNPIELVVTDIVYGKINGKPFVTSKVALPADTEKFSKNTDPHITLYHHPELKPEMSNDLLEGKAGVSEKGSISLGMKILTFLGIFTGKKATKGGTRKVNHSNNNTRKLRTNKH